MQVTYGCGEKSTVKTVTPARERKPTRRTAASLGVCPPAFLRELSIPSGVDRKTACNQ